MHGIDQLCRAIETNDLGLASELLATQRDLADSIEGTPPPIHWAIFHDKRRMVELLLEYGADIERRDQDRNATPLEYAIVYARTTIIPILVSRGADVEGMVGLAIKVLRENSTSLANYRLEMCSYEWLNNFAISEPTLSRGSDRPERPLAELHGAEIPKI